MNWERELKELASTVDDAYEEAVRKNVESNHKNKNVENPQRKNLDQYYNLNQSSSTTIVQTLESWMYLLRTLNERKSFLQHVSVLSNVFKRANSLNPEEARSNTTRTLLNLMISAAEHGNEVTSVECYFVTVMEVIDSFSENWRMSTCCSCLWEQVKLPEKYDVTTPQTFRRTAYFVLINLPWIPSSPGLKAICYEDDDEENFLSSKGENEIPTIIRSVFSQIRSTPLPRKDGIDQLLDHFMTTKSSVTVGITSAQYFNDQTGSGRGKTTLAAMLMIHPSIQSNFCVLWLQLDHRKGFTMTYQCYISYLCSLCEQLGVQYQWPQSIKSLEESSLIEKREEEKMFQVKREMSLILEQVAEKDILIVLDDVIDDQEIEWFRFSNNQSLLVTTSSQILGVDWTLELELLNEDEALQLFLMEAGYPHSSHEVATSRAAQSIMKRCGYHPLTIKTVARWFHLKHAISGLEKGLQNIDRELASCTAKFRHSKNKNNDHRKTLVEAMNLMLSPVASQQGKPTILMKICFSSMAVVFPNERVPIEAVHLLWSQLLQSESDAAHEIGNYLKPSQIQRRVSNISESLISLGLLSSTEKGDILYLEIPHEMQAEYAIKLLRKLYRSAFSLTEILCRWHGAFVSAYLAKKVEDERKGSYDRCRTYALEKLIHHMLKARLYQEVVALLQDERFLFERIKSMRWEKGISTHIADSIALQEAMSKDDAVNVNPESVMTSIFGKIGTFIANSKHLKEEVSDAAEALHSLGFCLAKTGRYSEAISQYQEALKMIGKGSGQLTGTILYSCSVVYLAQMEFEKGLKTIKDCIKVVGENTKSNELYAEVLMLKADALMLDDDYQGAMEFYDMSLERLSANPTNNRVQIGIVLGRKGRLYLLLGEFENAFDTFCGCIGWKEKISENSCELAAIYNYMGDVCLLRGDRNDGLLYFDRSYRMYEYQRKKNKSFDENEIEIHIINGKTDDLDDNYEGCRENFELARTAMRKSKQQNIERMAYNLRVMARTCIKNEDRSLAMKLLNDCLQLLDRRENSLERSGARSDMGDMHLHLEQNEMALKCYQESLKIQLQKISQSPDVIWTCLKIGRLHSTEGNWEEALSFFRKAVDVTERVFGENDVFGDILFEMADIHLKMNEGEEAIQTFENCLDFRRKQFDGPHPAISEVLEGLGRVHLKIGNYEKAYSCLVEALEIRQATMKQDHPDTATTFHLIGVVERMLGDCERALNFLLNALHIRKNQEDQGDTAMTLTEIGHVHRQLKDDFSALCCYEKSMEIINQHYGNNNTRLIDIYLPLGNIKRRQGSIDEAKDYYECALQISEERLGDKHRKTGTVCRNLAFLHFENKLYDEALKNFDTFITIQDMQKGKKGADYILALQLIGDIKRYQNKTYEANSSFLLANNAYSSNKEVAKKYPTFGPVLERRVSEEKKRRFISPLNFWSY